MRAMLLACGLLLSASPALAQRTDLPPADRVNEALDNHPSVAAAAARVEAARARDEGVATVGAVRTTIGAVVSVCVLVGVGVMTYVLAGVTGPLTRITASMRSIAGGRLDTAILARRVLTRDEVPADIVAAEKDVLEKKTLEEGKPEAAVAKIVEGRLGGFFKEIVLLEQESVTESKKTVKQVLDEAGTTVKRFARFEVGA